MPAVKASPQSIPVPMLDVNRENTQLRGEVDAAIVRGLRFGCVRARPGVCTVRGGDGRVLWVEACHWLRFGQRCAACLRCWRWASGRATK